VICRLIEKHIVRSIDDPASPPTPDLSGDDEYVPETVPGDPEDSDSANNTPTGNGFQEDPAAPLHVALGAGKPAEPVASDSELTSPSLATLMAGFKTPACDSRHRDAASICISATRKPSQTTSGKSNLSAANDEQSAPSAPDETLINELISKADHLYKQSEATEYELLKQRNEVGVLLLRLKEEVGHGNFLKDLKRWIGERKLNFSYATANRAMAYAGLDADGKLSSVKNLAEAERIRKAEAKRKKAERNAAKAAEDNETGEPEPPPPQAKLDRAKALQKAQGLAKPAIEECRSYEIETRIVVLEELIELLTEELDKITEVPEP
jgi:hypothetical protein